MSASPSGPSGASVSGTAVGNSGQVAIGTNIRQQAIKLIVQIDSGDPASLEKLAKAIRFDPLPERVTDWDRDFPSLVGRDATVLAAKHVFAARSAVSIFGEEGMGKSVLLRHLARRGTDGFSAGVVIVPASGNLWQDVGQDVVKAFYHAEVPVVLGPTELRRVLRDLDAAILLDDVEPTAGIDQLYAMCKNASFVVASVTPQLAGEVVGIALEGLDPPAAAELVRETLARAGGGDVDPATASRIGVALGGKPSEIIRVVQGAARRRVAMATLADELADPAGSRAAELAALSPSEHAVVEAVAALDGTPVGPGHVAAVVSEATTVTVNELLQGNYLRAASPQVRLDPELAAARGTVPQVDPDPIRERFLDHFIEWAGRRNQPAAAIAEESRAILFLLDWAERTGRAPEVSTLSALVEGPLALDRRWGAWEAVTSYRLRAAESRRDGRDAAIALNQIGVQALAHDAADNAREAFADARDRAQAAKAFEVAKVAERNLRLIGGLLSPPDDRSNDEPHDPIPEPKPIPPKEFPWALAIGGGVVLVVLAVIAFLLLSSRVALAIDPISRDLAPTTVQADGERATFTVTNTGAATLGTLDVALAGDGADQFFVVAGDCPGATLRAGQRCSVTLLFHPDRAGPASATLSITSKGGTLATASVRSQASEPTLAPTPTPTVTPSEQPSVVPKGQPDLAIRSFVPTGVPLLGDFLEVPVRVVIVNAGTSEAVIFPVVITANDRPVPFEVEGSDPLDVETRSPLGPKEAVTLDGFVRFDRGTQLDAVMLVVHADSCLRDPSAPTTCRVVESKEPNNSYPLQSVDLQIANLKLGMPQEPPGVYAALPPWMDVPISFDITNAGPEDAADFWIVARSGQVSASLEVPGYEVDSTTGLLRVPGLTTGEARHLDGIAHISRTSLDIDLTIAIGCPPGSEPCQQPEIAFDNNVASGTIPPPSTSTRVGAIFTANGD